MTKPTLWRRFEEFLKGNTVLEWDDDGTPGQWIDSQYGLHQKSSWLLKQPKAKAQLEAAKRLREKGLL